MAELIGVSSPGTIVALHLNYPSRIAQRGRKPEKPSYFIKPSNSVSVSGDPIERPAGTELLTFEGEVALVIGRTARRVSPEEGWSYVAAITAANDFGVYDLRLVDLPGGDTVQVGLHDDGEQCLVDPAASLQQRREEAALA